MAPLSKLRARRTDVSARSRRRRAHGADALRSFVGIAFLVAAHAAQATPHPPLPIDEPSAQLLDHDPAQHGVLVDRHALAPPFVFEMAFDNHVTARLAQLTEPIQSIALRITIHGAEQLETAETFGLSEAASIAFHWPASGRIAKRDVRARAKALGIELGDSGSLTISLDPTRDKLESAMQLAHALLTSAAIVDPDDLDAWKAAYRERLARPLDEDRLKDIALLELDYLLSGDDLRARRTNADDLTSITATAAQGWLDRHLASAPIDVLLLAPIPPDEAAALFAKYFGSLRAGAGLGAPIVITASRAPIGPLSRTIELRAPRQIPLAETHIGWRGIDDLSTATATATDDAPILHRAATILDGRLRRAHPTSAEGFGVASYLPCFLSSTGRFDAWARLDPRKVNAFETEVRHAALELAQHGPSATEIRAADQRAHSTYFVDQIFDVFGKCHAPDSARTTYSAAEIRRVLLRIVTPARSYRLVVKTVR